MRDFLTGILSGVELDQDGVSPSILAEIFSPRST